MPVFTNPKTNMQIFTFLRNACNRNLKAELLQIEGAKNPKFNPLCSSIVQKTAVLIDISKLPLGYRILFRYMKILPLQHILCAVAE